MPAGWRVPAGRLSFAILVVVGSSGLGRGGELSAQRIALEFEAMGVVDDAVEDGVGDGRLAGGLVPSVDRDLAGGEGCAAAVALLDDLQEIAALVGPERFEPPVVEDEQPHLAEPLHQPWIATVAAGECEVGEQLGHALIENGSVVATGFVAECAGEPGFADACRAFDDEVLWGVDPVAGDEPLEQCSIEAARGAVVDVLDGGALAEPGVAQPGGELPVGSLGGLAVEQQGEPLGVAEAGGAGLSCSSLKARAMPPRPRRTS